MSVYASVGESLTRCMRDTMLLVYGAVSRLVDDVIHQQWFCFQFFKSKFIYMLQYTAMK